MAKDLPFFQGAQPTGSFWVTVRHVWVHNGAAAESHKTSNPILKTRVPGLHNKPKLKYFGTFWNLSFSAHNGSIGFSFVRTDVRCIFVVHYDFRTSDFKSWYLNKKCRSLRDFYQATLYIGQQKLCQTLALFSVPNTKYINFSNGVVFFGTPCINKIGISLFSTCTMTK